MLGLTQIKRFTGNTQPALYIASPVVQYKQRSTVTINQVQRGLKLLNLEGHRNTNFKCACTSSGEEDQFPEGSIDEEQEPLESLVSSVSEKNYGDKITKKIIAEAVYDRLRSKSKYATGSKIKYSKALALEFVNEMCDFVKQSIEEGKQVRISGFGTFETKYSKAREARVVQTQEKVQVPAKYVPKFKFVKSYKARVESSEYGIKFANEQGNKQQ